MLPNFLSPVHIYVHDFIAKVFESKLQASTSPLHILVHLLQVNLFHIITYLSHIEEMKH